MAAPTVAGGHDRRAGHDRARWRRPSPTVSFLLLFVQAALGAIVVRRNLSPTFVTAHLATAMLLVGSLVLTTTAAWTLGRSRTEATDESRPFWIAAGIVYATILFGAFVRGEGAGLAFRDWPLMDGRLVPAGGWGEAEASQFLHRMAALLSVGAVAWAAAVAWRRRAERGSAAAYAAAGLLLIGVQVMVGALNVWTDLAQWARILHIALAALTWSAVVAAASLARTETAAAP
ncbi:MAG: COX15/CtaA family protein [Actinobacteria bacterium]|nr:COX15/CtaA family protein [Actinomycetota bacterium]